MLNQKKILIFGPLNSRGGRELEAGFIASILSKSHKVSLCSTTQISANNDILLVDKNLNIYKKHLNYTDKIIKRLFKTLTVKQLKVKSLKSREVKSLREMIIDNDLIIILAQVLSLHIEEVVNIAKRNGKKVIFRTTGTIPLLRKEYKGIIYDLKYLEEVDEYIHHTHINADSLSRVITHNYSVIDQSIFNEIELMQARKSRANIKQFYTCSRLDTNKNVGVVIQAFNTLTELDVELHIYGDGYELSDLKQLKRNKNIHFHGHIPYNKLLQNINKHDCLIISSIEEAGPYTGLEAMCLGIPVISTRVGSMPERFKGLDFMWFEHDNVSELKERITDYINFETIKIEKIQNELTARYDSTYNHKKIQDKYLNTIENYLM